MIVSALMTCAMKAVGGIADEVGASSLARHARGRRLTPIVTPDTFTEFRLIWPPKRTQADEVVVSSFAETAAMPGIESSRSRMRRITPSSSR